MPNRQSCIGDSREHPTNWGRGHLLQIRCTRTLAGAPDTCSCPRYSTPSRCPPKRTWTSPKYYQPQASAAGVSLFFCFPRLSIRLSAPNSPFSCRRFPLFVFSLQPCNPSCCHRAQGCVCHCRITLRITLDNSKPLSGAKILYSDANSSRSPPSIIWDHRKLGLARRTRLPSTVAGPSVCLTPGP